MRMSGTVVQKKSSLTKRDAETEHENIFARCVRVSDLFRLLRLSTIVYEKYVVDRQRYKENS
jgi:hypothetical protein